MVYGSRAIVLVLILGTLFAGIAPVRVQAALIDDIAGATFAFSISRYLRTAEIGNPVARFRESATGNELDFKLDGSNALISDDVNEYTVSEWMALTSATTTFVVSVYDQSGNGRTFTAPSSNQQPILTTSTALGGIAAMDFTNESDIKLISVSFSMNDEIGLEIFALVEPTTMASSFADAIVFGNGAASLALAGGGLTGWWWQPDFNEDVYASTAPVDTVGYQMTWRYLGFGTDTFVIRENGTEVANEVNAGGTADWRSDELAIGNHSSAAGSQFAWEGLISEIVFYNGLYSADDISDVETSMQTHAGLAGEEPASVSLPYRLYNLGTFLLSAGTVILN